MTAGPACIALGLTGALLLAVGHPLAAQAVWLFSNAGLAEVNWRAGQWGKPGSSWPTSSLPLGESWLSLTWRPRADSGWWGREANQLLSPEDSC